MTGETRAAAPATAEPATRSSRRRALVAAGSMLATGVALGVAFFPVLFNYWGWRDDEGVFVFGLREFLSHHGHLYSTIGTDLYGPFYYLFMSTVYRLLHQQPTLENGRWISLTLVVAAAVMFGAAVWRITKSVPSSLLCETAAFVILVKVAGNEPMHPGWLGVFLIAIVTFEVSSYAVTRHTAHLVAVGAVAGALMMTKVNVGGLITVAIVFAFVVGSRNTPRWMQITVGVLTALLPILLVFQHISDAWAATLASVVVVSIAGMCVVMSIDQLSLPRFPLLPFAAGAAAVVVCSLAFPVVTGTRVTDEIAGVLIRPLSLPNAFFVPTPISLEWFTVVLTAAGIAVFVGFQSRSRASTPTELGWMQAALAVLALWLLGLGATVFITASVATWLPTIVLLPAFAFCGDASESIRLALRTLVAVAVLQVLVVYPVAGSQVAWGTVAMVVPCGIALAVGAERSRMWRDAGLLLRGGATAVLCLALIVATVAWPLNLWQTYIDNQSLGLPGTGLMRINPDIAETVQVVTQSLRANCDTFYGVPNENGFYIFSGLPALTGMTENGGPAGLTTDQRDQVVKSLREKAAAHERVCILRDSRLAITMPRGPLTHLLNEYSSVVATVGPYTISRHP